MFTHRFSATPKIGVLRSGSECSGLPTVNHSDTHKIGVIPSLTNGRRRRTKTPVRGFVPPPLVNHSDKTTPIYMYIGGVSEPSEWFQWI